MAATSVVSMPRQVRVWVLTVAAAAVLGVATQVDTAALAALVHPLPLVLVAGIALAEVFSVWDFGRPRSCTLTISELFTGVAFAVLEPDAALVVGAAGSLATPPLRRTVGPLRRIPARHRLVLLHSVAMPVLRTVAGVVVLVAALAPLGQPWAALLGLGALLLADAAMTAVVVHLDTGLPLRRAVLTDPIVELAVPLGAGTFGVLLGRVLGDDPRAWLVVAALSAAVVAMSHAGTRWSRERRRSRVLVEIARSSVRTDQEEEVEQLLVPQVGDALLARRVEVVQAPVDWAEMSASLGGHGYLAVAGRTIPSQGFDHRDRELLDEVATLATVVLDNAGMLDRLADEEELRSTLLAAAAHDLRSPLAITAGVVETLGTHHDLDGAVRERLLDSASRATRRAGRLVHDLIVLEQQHLGAVEEVPCADLEEVVARVLEALEEQENARCRLEVRDGVPPVAMSPVLLERVVDNLVGNAIKHTSDGGAVVVRIRSSGGSRAVLAVEDRGPGVPPEQRERLLAPFTQAVANSSGFGLGLHIAAEFVRRAGGELVISDRRGGPGASFQVHLPTVGQAAPVEATER